MLHNKRMMKSGSIAAADRHHLQGLLKQLRAIEFSVRMRSNGGPGPRSFWAALAAGAGVAISIAVKYLAERAGANVPTAILWIALAAALPAMCLVNRYSVTPRTYGEKITKLLRAYDPVDVDAYLELQKRGQRFGSFETGTLYDWIWLERCAVHEALERSSAHALASAAIERARGK